VLVDARSLDRDSLITTDICVIGAGAAGITLAREFSGLPVRVCLVEAGGLKPDRQTQRIGKGESVGHSYFLLDETRVFGFGGSTMVWNGACRPMDPIDFEPRGWVPYSGWPFPFGELDPFYARAHEVCQLGPYAYEPALLSDGQIQPFPLSPNRVKTDMFQISPPTRFGSVYRKTILGAPNILTLLHAPVEEIEIEDPSVERSVASRARIILPNGARARIAARVIVLACGGLENARVLLSSRSARPDGLGNEHGLVGRFFMEHPYITAGRLVLNPQCGDARLYSVRRVHIGPSSTLAEGVLAIADPALEEAGLLRCAIHFPPQWRAQPEFATEGVNSVRQLVRGIRHVQVPYESNRHLRHVVQDAGAVLKSAVGFGLHRLRGPRGRRILYARTYCEQAPDPNSTVTLSTQRDHLGRQRVKLDWRLSERELQTLTYSHATLAAEVQRAGIGRFDSPLLGADDAWRSAITGGFHHMGTSRMHVSPTEGVVDQNARVHSTANLYVTGSSVFPTGGYANPTLTIVAVALRLADHLKRTVLQ
jgi:choline dehydrogenase-like flavoprotein